MINIKSVAFIFAVAFGCIELNATTIKGEFKIDELQKPVRYEYETASGDYSLNLEDSIQLKMSIEKDELKKIDCEKEKEASKRLFTKRLQREYVVGTKRDLVHLDLELNGALVNLKKIESKIESDLRSKGVDVRPLKLSTRVVPESFDVNFEWMDNSITNSAANDLPPYIEENIKKQIGNYTFRYPFFTNGKSSISTNFHFFVCDLINKKVDLHVNTNIDFKSSVRRDSLMTKDQIKSLNNSLLKKQGLLDSADDLSSGKRSYGDSERMKIINSSALLAFEIQKLGFDESILRRGDTFSSLYDGMYLTHKFEVELLDESRLDKLYRDLLVWSEDMSNQIKIQNKKVELEVR